MEKSIVEQINDDKVKLDLQLENNLKNMSILLRKRSKKDLIKLVLEITKDCENLRFHFHQLSQLIYPQTDSSIESKVE